MGRYSVHKAFIVLIVGFVVLGVITIGGCGLGVFKTVINIIGDKHQSGSLEGMVFSKCSGKWGNLINNLMSDNKTYVVLLQNNMELRASGGFMGSYLKVKTSKRGISEMLVQDIYVPDGQIQGHVEPPYPIQEAFGQGWWRLRDSNWNIDFEKAALDTVWFLEKGGEAQVDGLVAINLSLAKRLIGIYGPLKISTYDQSVNEGNFYSLAQKQAEIGFFPGSTQKRDFLGAVTVVFEEEMRSAGLAKNIKTVKLIWEQLDNGQIMAWFKEPEAQREIKKLGWDGGIIGKWDTKSDYLYIVESNLGVNKANCCIDRFIEKTIELSDNMQESRLNIRWKNNNSQSVPKPPESWGGDYVDYVRVVIPEKAEVLKVVVGEAELVRMEESQLNEPSSLRQGKSINKYNESMVGEELKAIGFWANVAAGKEVTAEIVTRNSNVDNEKYRLFVRRQPGVENIPMKLSVNGRIEFDDVLIMDAYIK